MASDIRAPTTKLGKPREKVALKPGFHLMDWHRLMQASKNFDCRDGGPPRRISMEELKSHNKEFDCWTAYNGKVYNITQYMQYHPGGVKQLMAGAGKDCTKAFNKFHAWVNIDNILAKCYIGPLMEASSAVAEGDEGEDNELGSDDEDAAALAKERKKLQDLADEKSSVRNVGNDSKQAFKVPVTLLGQEQLQAQARAALDMDPDAKGCKSGHEEKSRSDPDAVSMEKDGAKEEGEEKESDADFVERRERDDAEAFRLAVDEWRSEKAAGRGEAQIEEVGGDFATEGSGFGRSS